MGRRDPARTPMPQPTALASPQPERSLREARALIAAELGRERLAALHRPNLLLDVVSIVGALALFVVLAWQLGTGSARDPLWWVYLFVQGNLVLILAYIHHDAFVHRKMLPRPLRWIVASMLTWPSQMRAGAYEQQHLLHHRALGTGQDSERYKHDIDTRLRRALYATAAAMFFRVVLFRGRTASQAVGLPQRSAASPQAERRHRYDRAAWLLLVVLAALVATWNWRVVVYGYLLPFAVVTPVLNSVRIALEHLDLDPANPLWTGTFYRTGFLTRLMFWWDAGDCHLVHHFYPSIPFYRIGSALEVIRPILVRHGLFEHRSVAPLLRDWFVDGRAYWSLPPQAAESEAGPALGPDSVRPAA